MKRLDELGISPTPWHCVAGSVFPTGDWDEPLCEWVRSNADARLIKTAPKLYDALQKIVACWGSSSCECGVEHGPPMYCQLVGCKPQKCPIILNAKSVLAEAAGENEVNNEKQNR